MILQSIGSRIDAQPRSMISPVQFSTFLESKSVMLSLKVVVVDQLESVRETIRKLVQRHSGWQVCAEAEEEIDIVKTVEHWRPNLLVIDVQEPVANALSTIRQIAERHPAVRILATSVYVTQQLAEKVRAAGGHGMVEKVDLTRHLDDAIQAFRDGRPFFPILPE